MVLCLSSAFLLLLSFFAIGLRRKGSTLRQMASLKCCLVIREEKRPQPVQNARLMQPPVKSAYIILDKFPQMHHHLQFIGGFFLVVVVFYTVLTADAIVFICKLYWSNLREKD